MSWKVVSSEAEIVRFDPLNCIAGCVSANLFPLTLSSVHADELQYFHFLTGVPCRLPLPPETVQQMPYACSASGDDDIELYAETLTDAMKRFEEGWEDDFVVSELPR